MAAQLDNSSAISLTGIRVVINKQFSVDSRRKILDTDAQRP